MFDTNYWSFISIFEDRQLKKLEKESNKKIKEKENKIKELEDANKKLKTSINKSKCLKWIVKNKILPIILGHKK